MTTGGLPALLEYSERWMEGAHVLMEHAGHPADPHTVDNCPQHVSSVVVIRPPARLGPIAARFWPVAPVPGRVVRCKSGGCPHLLCLNVSTIVRLAAETPLLQVRLGADVNDNTREVPPPPRSSSLTPFPRFSLNAAR